MPNYLINSTVKYKKSKSHQKIYVHGHFGKQNSLVPTMNQTPVCPAHS